MSGESGVVVFRNVDLPHLRRLAELLHEHLPSQAVIALEGTLGAGKTRFVQELAGAAEIDPADVTSPTFTLVQHYQGSRTLHHIDAYRLADEDEFIELGGEELFEDDAWVVVEWPQRIAASLPNRTMFLEIEIDAPAGAAEHPDADLPASTRTIRGHSGDPELRAALLTIERQWITSGGADR